ncbi:MAG TPA: response regulator [Steroidobacteraceae bacterium]|nr:response regulator [Steroidobacteraceae bacterium]
MSYTVLIVDDSKLARMSVARVLGTLYPAWKRIEAANAVEAVQQTKELAPDVALVDFNMPGKDGVTLAAELRALDPKLSVAVISANRQVEVIKRTEAAGATFLPKPLTESALAAFLTSTLSAHKAAPP